MCPNLKQRFKLNDNYEACDYFKFTEEYLQCMKKHLVENHTNTPAKQEFIFVDCLSAKGPVNSNYLQEHMGTHPDFLRGVIRQLKAMMIRPFHA